MRLLLVLFACLAGVLWAPLDGSVAEAQTSARPGSEPRHALLIGNKGYAAKVGPLVNPHTDVDLVGKALESLGFDVTIVKDATYKAMDTSLKRYVAKVRRAGPGAVSFFYYSGHGVANPETRINYLVPIDVTDADDDRIWYESFQHHTIIDTLTRQAPGALHYVVLDACRNELNLTKAGAKSLGAEKGFVPIGFTSGVLVAYATAPGKTAADGGPGGGPYARALAEEIVKPGVEAYSMFRNVGLRVKQDTRQDPWLSSSTLPAVFLAGQVAPPPPPPPKESGRAPAAGWSTAEREWQQYAKDSADLALLEAFKRKHRDDPVYVRLAEVRIETLRREAAAAAAKTKAKAERDSAETALSAVLSAEAERVRAGEAARRKAAEDALGRDAALAVTPGSGQAFRDCPTCPDMVVVPAGSFMMGSPEGEAERASDEGPQRTVTIARPFAVGKFEVTFAEWDACVAGGGCAHKPGDQGWGRGQRPVINVSWDDGRQYVAWLSRKTGKPYRLLTEAEWEYAARAGTTTPFATGATITTAQANFDGNYTYGGSAKGQYRQRTTQVGSFAANAFGLHDMHGNVWEWVEDCWIDSYKGAPSTEAARTTACTDDTRRVVRGGSWYVNPRSLRSADRLGNSAVVRDVNLGFRVARSVSR